MTASDICSALDELPVTSGHICSSKTFTLQVDSTSALQHTCVTLRQSVHLSSQAVRCITVEGHFITAKHQLLYVLITVTRHIICQNQS